MAKALGYLLPGRIHRSLRLVLAGTPRYDAAIGGLSVVETKFHHDVPLTGLDVLAMYEATDKEIKPLYTRAGTNGGIALLFGIFLALVLALVGHIFNWCLQRTIDPAR